MHGPSMTGDVLLEIPLHSPLKQEVIVQATGNALTKAVTAAEAGGERAAVTGIAKGILQR